MEKITSRTNAKIQFILSLKDIKNISKHHLFVDEGIKNLKMALLNDSVEEIYTTKNLKLNLKNVPTYIINQSVLEKISNSKTPDGVVFVAKVKKYDIYKMNKIVFLDKVQDPGNVGTIIRTALAFNLDGVILGDGCASLYNHKTLAACKGAMYEMPVASLKFEELIKQKKKEQKIIATTLSDDSIELSKFHPIEKFIIVFGNEGSGVSESALLSADYKIKIGIKNIDSLNVAISAGIILHFLKNNN